MEKTGVNLSSLVHLLVKRKSKTDLSVTACPGKRTFIPQEVQEIVEKLEESTVASTQMNKYKSGPMRFT